MARDDPAAAGTAGGGVVSTLAIVGGLWLMFCFGFVAGAAWVGTRRHRHGGLEL